EKSSRPDLSPHLEAVILQYFVHDRRGAGFIPAPRRRSIVPGPGPVMDERSHGFLRELLETPSPSGYERPIQNVVRQWATPLADEVSTDRHGNVIAALFPQAATPAPLKVL